MVEPTYCPVCTHPLEPRESGGRMRPACPECGYVHYVNPVPTVGVVIEMDDGGVVLIRRRNPPHQGQWAFPSGYVEADERLEEAAIREAEEETGLHVKIIELADVNSYPEGPPASGIMIFYRARPVGGTLQAGDDAVEAQVFAPQDVPLLPFRTHREMMAQWLTNHTDVPPPPNLAPRDQPYVIRPAHPEDAQQIIELVRMIPANHGLSDNDWEAAHLRLREMTALAVYVAQLRTGPPLVIGCVVLSVVHVITGGFGFINDMAVLPTYRRQGVGAALLEAAMRRAAALNLDTLLINTARASQASQAFYQAAGFSDQVIMRLHLR